MKKLFLLSLIFSSISFVQAQITAPEIVSWIQTPGQTGYSGIASNVQAVNYTSSNVYVSCTCIPGYDIGPWAGNPNTPANQNFCFVPTFFACSFGAFLSGCSKHSSESQIGIRSSEDSVNAAPAKKEFSA